MGRIAKETVDYFPHMAVSGKTLFLLESKFGNNGYTFWFKLLESLCQTKGLCMDMSVSADLMFLAAKARIEPEEAIQMLDLLAELEAIDQVLWRENSVVWSQNLRVNLDDLFRKRKAVAPEKPCFSADNGGLPEISADIRGINPENQGFPEQETPETGISDVRNTQIKLNEIKDKDLKNNVPPSGDAPPENEKPPKSPKASGHDKTTRIFGPASPEYKIAAYLLGKIMELDSKARQPNLQLWAMDIDKMIRLDNRTPAEVKDLIDFSHGDSFWRKNILSASKLREKATALTAAMKAKSSQGGPGYGSNAKHAAENSKPSKFAGFDASQHQFRSDG